MIRKSSFLTSHLVGRAGDGSTHPSISRRTKRSTHHPRGYASDALLRRAQRIVFLRHGRVEADGEHEMLLLTSSAYAAAYDYWEKAERQERSAMSSFQ